MHNRFFAMLDKLGTKTHVGGTTETASSSEVDEPRFDPVDQFERRDKATAERQRQQNAKTRAGFMMSAVQWVARRPATVAAVLMAISLPLGMGLSAPSAAQEPTIEVVESPPAPAEAAANQALSLPSTPKADDPYAQHIRDLRAAIVANGLVPRADGVPIWVVADRRTGPDMVRAIGHPDVGLAPGARLFLDMAETVVDRDHQKLREDVSADLEEVATGAALTDELVRDLSSLIVYDAAGRVKSVNAQRVEGRTNIVAMSFDQSPRDVARRLLDALERAPAESEARKYLESLGDDEDERLGALADRVYETTERERGSRAVWSAERRLRRELDDARDNGLLILRAAGDTRHKGDPSRRSRPLADGLEQLLTIGAANMDGEMHSSSGFGVISLAAKQRNSDQATAHVAATLGLMLAGRPNATPDELEYLLTSSTARNDVPETARDGLGLIDVPAAISEALTAGHIPLLDARDRYRAHMAMRSGRTVPEDHAYRQHIRHVHEELAERGLPTRGDGVKVFVIEGGWSTHNGSVLRTIADEELGIAPGADVHLVTSSPWYDDRERELSRSISAGKRRVLGGDAPADALIMDMAERTVLSRAADVRGIAERVDGTETSFINMSFGTTSSSIAETLIEHMTDAPEGSAAAAYLSGLGDTDDDRLHEMIRRVRKVLDTPASTTRVRRANKSLAAELKAARDKRVIAYTSAGNARDEIPEEGHDYSTHIADDVPGLMVIGATEYNDPKRFGDDRMTGFSSEGHIVFAAPGSKMPIKRDGSDGRGTSYASPYGVGVGVLMVAANPDLTPDDIERIQRGATHDIPTELDGEGVIDPIAAVERAAESR